MQFLSLYKKFNKNQEKSFTYIVVCQAHYTDKREVFFCPSFLTSPERRSAQTGEMSHYSLSNTYSYYTILFIIFYHLLVFHPSHKQWITVSKKKFFFIHLALYSSFTFQLYVIIIFHSFCTTLFITRRLIQ